MAALEFACTPPAGPAIAEAEAWLTQCPLTERNWLLVDAALVDADRLDRILRRHRVNEVNAYEQSGLMAFGVHSPRLIACQVDIAATKALLAALLALDGGGVALSAIRTGRGVSAADLQHVFAYLALVRIEAREKPVHCRFADVRVLPHVLRILTPAQLAPVRKQVQEWGWFDRIGVWQTADLPATAVPGELSLKLDIEQFRKLQSAAEADGLFLIMTETTPEVVPDRDRGAFHARIEAALLDATARGVHRADDRLQFAMLSLTCRPAFHGHPQLASTWEQLAAGASTLKEEMQQWDDALWADLSKGDVG